MWEPAQRRGRQPDPTDRDGGGGGGQGRVTSIRAEESALRSGLKPYSRVAGARGRQRCYFHCGRLSQCLQCSLAGRGRRFFDDTADR